MPGNRAVQTSGEPPDKHSKTKTGRGGVATPGISEKPKPHTIPDANLVPVEDDPRRQPRNSVAWPSPFADDSLDDDAADRGETASARLRAGSDKPDHAPDVSLAKLLARNADAGTAGYWLLEIKAVLVKSVTSLIEAGQLLIEAKKCLDHGEWLKMFTNGQLPFGERQAQYLMQVAGHRVLTNPNHRSLLPQSRTALVELAKGDETKVEEVIRDGKIHPALTAKEARLLVRAADKEDAGGVAGRNEDAAKLCDRRLKVVGRYIQEAKGWPTEQRRRFCSETASLFESLVT